MYMAKAKSLETLEIHEEPVLAAGRLIGFAVCMHHEGFVYRGDVDSDNTNTVRCAM